MDEQARKSGQPGFKLQSYSPDDLRKQKEKEE